MKQKKRLHFGVLFSSIDNTCQCKIWEGIVMFAKKHNIHLTAYLGTYQSKDDFDSHYETCFQAIKNSAVLDGLIMFSGFIAEDIGIEKFKKHISELPKTLPLVSVSFPIEGIPSVLVDNEKGIFDAVEHLVKHHSKENIAFVKGPDGHPEAESRLLGYKKALKENGIEFDKRYVLKGHFSEQSGREAITELLDVRKIPFDSIVASDDETAIGVMEELDARKILVPTNVAVTGFDDDAASETYIPSLSTARQMFFEIGNVAANTLCEYISGKEVPEIFVVAPDFIARQSCGCLEESVVLSRLKNDNVVSASFIYPFVLRKFISIFPKSIPITQVHSWATVLVEKITENPFNRKSFLHLFNEILIHYRRYSRDFASWHDAVEVLFESIELYQNEIVNMGGVISTLNSASTLIHSIHYKENKCRELILGDAQRLLRKSANKLVLTFDIDSLGDKLQQLLPELSIYTAIVGFYKQSITAGDSNASRTIDKVIGFDEQKAINVKLNANKPISFANHSSINGFDFERELRTLFFIPLFFNDEELGVALLPYNNVNPIDIYETLRINISTAVKGAELMAKVRTLSITDELTGLLNRRGFFQFAYARLPYLNRHCNISPVVLFMDMDGLKLINDTYGHKEGDTAIAVCAKLLREVLREEDIIGRIGGDEFVAFTSVKTAENSKDVIRRIRKKFDDYNARKNHPYLVSCSVGAVILEPGATREKFDLTVQDADSVLYAEKMKKKGKGLARQ